MSKFAENLKARRTALGLTQEALAEKIHVTRQAISNWENEKNQPDLEMLALLSWALEVDVSTLLGGQAPPRSRGNLRRAAALCLVSAAAALAVRLLLFPALQAGLQYSHVTWPALLYIMLLRPLLWLLGGWTAVAVLHVWPGLPPLEEKTRRILFWCGLAWFVFCMASPCLGYLVNVPYYYVFYGWVWNNAWIHLPGALAMALGVLKSR